MVAKKNSSASSVYHIIALCFADRSKGERVAKDVKSQQKLQGYKVVGYAVVEVDEKGKSHIHEPGHGGIGSGAGAVVGGLLGLVGGPAGLLAWTVAGAAVGGISGHYMGRLVPEKDLKELASHMQPNSSAFLALVEDTDTEKVIDALDGYQANIVTLTVGDEASGTLGVAVAADITASGTSLAGDTAPKENAKPAADSSAASTSTEKKS
jgi:uncharacterized membrane protein